ncbi:MAG: RluA family pseudouridine synthase [Thermoflavifilum aggregans]|nr:RluA family pseudouridine synthase [Thermoflavifilum aggregans]
MRVKIPADDAELYQSDEFERLLITVDGRQEPVRVDKYLTQRIAGISRNRIQQAIEAGLVKWLDPDGQQQPRLVKANYKVKPGDRFEVWLFVQPDTEEIIPEPVPLNIVYEDEHVIVINKPAGLVVHPGNGNYSGTLVNGLAYHLQNTASQELPRWGLVHRIDKNTSGLLVVAKSDLALRHLARQFYEHTTERKYLALVWGDLPQDSGTIRAHIGRHQRYRQLMDAYPDGEYGKEAVTHYRVLERFYYVTLVECQLETGRTHQIRVHMQHIGHPLFNDETYGGNRIVKGTIYRQYKDFVNRCFEIMPRQALHAQTLGFTHPATGERIYFEVPLPDDFRAVLEAWREYVSALQR